MGKIADVARNMFLKAGYGKLDKVFLKRWPKGWPAAKEAARGWKVLLGVLVLYAPDILTETKTRLEGLNIDPTQTLAWMGTALVVVGAAHKFLKFFVAFEFSGDLEDVKGKSVPVRSQPVLKTEEEHDAFFEAYNRLRARGIPFGEAREEALKVVLAKREGA